MTRVRHRVDRQAACGLIRQAESPTSFVVDFEDAHPLPTASAAGGEPLRLLAGLLASGYLRLLAHRDDHRQEDGPGHNPSISLDSPPQQSDELDRPQRPRRSWCKQI